METRCVLVCFLMVIAHLEVQGIDNYKEIKLIGHACGMSSQYYDTSTRTSSDCHGAINGNTSQFLMITPTLQNCINTKDSNDPAPVWWVDMGRDYTVFYIRIFAREGQETRLKYLAVAIDRHVVYETKGNIPATTVQGNGFYFDTFDVPNLPYTGRNLTISRNDLTAASWDKALNFCEVEVWECADGFYGVDCSPCRCTSPNICNKTTGCACNVTYWGTENCSLSCENCGGDGSCGMANGQCLSGCSDGWAGAACTQKLQSLDNDIVNVGGVAGGVVAAVVAIAIGVVAGVIFFRSRRSRAMPTVQEPSLHAIHVEGAPKHASTEQTSLPENPYDQLENTRDEVKPYTQLQPDESHTQGHENPYDQLAAQYHNTDDVKPYEALSLPARE